MKTPNLYTPVGTKVRHYDILSCKTDFIDTETRSAVQHELFGDVVFVNGKDGLVLASHCEVLTEK